MKARSFLLDSRGRRTTRLAAALAAAAGALLLVTAAGAVVTSAWSVETYAQFDQGDAADAIVTSLGELRPGWATKRVAVPGDAAWAALELADGSTLVGSDADGSIYQVTASGATKLAALDGAIAVVALVQAPGGAVYAGSMPGAGLWRIDVKTGKATQLAPLPGVETIWSLAAGKDGTIYAGTGPEGNVFAISTNGTKGGAGKESASKVFATEDKRVTALAIAADGALWIGTSERALVFRYDGKVTRAMADFAGNEITAITAFGSGVVVAAHELADPPTSASKSAAQLEVAEKPNAPKGVTAKTPDVGTKPGADRDPPAISDLGRRGARKGKGALFRIDNDGRYEQLHALTQTYFTSLAIGPDQVIYAGAADKGRVYEVDPDDSVATAYDVDERAVSHVWWSKGGIAFTTDDATALYRTNGHAAAAKYVSDVLDTKAVSKLGRIFWQSSGSTVLETRSGNIAKPGVGWSDWSAPSDTKPFGAAGNNGKSGQMSSPAGRYVQFRATLRDDDARLRRVTLFYAPQNQATSVEEVTIEQASRDNLPTMKDGAARSRSPVLRIKWKIENPDGDDTTYTLDARRDGEAEWRPLPIGKTPVAGASWEWNTESVPDGWYRVRVTSSDAAANSPDRVLSTSQTSVLFTVDNTRPTIEGLEVTYPKVTARASDAMSLITEMAYAIDDGPWQIGTSVDGLMDDAQEELRIDLPTGDKALARGTHTLAVRVADVLGNVAAQSTTFVVK